MALVDYIPPEDAAGRTRELLESYRDEYGESALFNEALANNPAMFEARFEYGNRVMNNGDVDPATKEFLFVVVSEANECEYCLGDHRDRLIDRFDGDETVLDAVMAGEFDRLSDRKRAVAEFADQVARDPKRLGESHLRALHDVGYDDAEVVELLVAATLAVSANSIVDALSIHPVDKDRRE